MKVAFIEGKDIYLRELRLGDLEGNWYKWLNDVVVTKFQNKGIFPNTFEKQKAYYEMISTSDTDVVLAIIDKKTDKHIGNVGLHHIDWIHRSAEIGIVIGEKEFWGKGYGRKAWNLMTEYGFTKLNLHRIFAWILKDNMPSIKSAVTSGFKKEGEVRDFLYKNGKYYTMVYMNILKHEFKKLI